MGSIRTSDAKSDNRGQSLSQKYADNFWSSDDSGYNAMMKRMSSNKHVCERLLSYFRERISIEDEYAKKMAKLAKMPIAEDEETTMKDSLNSVLIETEAIVNAREEMITKMKTQLEQALTNFASSLRERRKQIQLPTDKLHKTLLNHQQQIEKLREKYESDCLKMNGYTVQSNLLLGKELLKNNSRLEKAQLSMQSSERQYQTAVKLAQDVHDKWCKQWKSACEKYQSLDEERIDVLKAILWDLTNIHSTSCVQEDDACERIRVTLEKCDAEKDIKTFIKIAGTGTTIPNAPVYQNYNVNSPPSEKGFMQILDRNVNLSDDNDDNLSIESMNDDEPTQTETPRFNFSPQSRGQIGHVNDTNDLRISYSQPTPPASHGDSSIYSRSPVQDEVHSPPSRPDGPSSSNLPQNLGDVWRNQEKGTINDPRRMSRKDISSQANLNEHFQNVKLGPSSSERQMKCELPPKSPLRAIRQEDRDEVVEQGTRSRKSMNLSCNDQGFGTHFDETSDPRRLYNERQRTSTANPERSSQERTSLRPIGLEPDPRLRPAPAYDQYNSRDQRISQFSPERHETEKMVRRSRPFAQDSSYPTETRSRSRAGTQTSNHSDRSPRNSYYTQGISQMNNPISKQRADAYEHDEMSVTTSPARSSRGLLRSPDSARGYNSSPIGDVHYRESGQDERGRSIADTIPEFSRSRSTRRARSRSRAARGNYTEDGLPILGYVKALYDYQAAIPEEIGFREGDTLMVLRTQEDGWWEGEVVAPQRTGQRGLFPSNFIAT